MVSGVAWYVSGVAWHVMAWHGTVYVRAEDWKKDLEESTTAVVLAVGGRPVGRCVLNVQPRQSTSRVDVPSSVTSSWSFALRSQKGDHVAAVGDAPP